MEQRIFYLDVAKTICIFLMVVGHWTSNGLLLTYIYSFHMPALFVVSGMLYKPRPFLKTILSFGIPVSFYSILNLFFLVLIGRVDLSQVLTKEMALRFFHYRYGLGDGLFMGDWFIWALMAIRMFMGDICIINVCRKYYVLLSMIVVVYMSFETYLFSIDAIFRGWYIGRAIPSLPFFCFGLFLKEQKWYPKSISNIYLYIMVVAVILIPLVNGYCSINENEFGCSYIFFGIDAIIVTLLLFYVASKLHFSKVITTFSKGTLFILGLHIPIMQFLSMVFPSDCYDYLPLLVLPICYFPILWIDRYCPELLGKVRWKCCTKWSCMMRC